MSRKSKSSQEYFKELEGVYKTWDDLDQAVVDLCNNNLALLPLGYTYLDLLEWGKGKKWIFKENGGYRVRVK